MATVPLSGTKIEFLSGIPWANDYESTRWFGGLSDQRDYFSKQPVVHRMNRANIVKIDGSHRIPVNTNIDNLWGVNYVMFENESNNPKQFYAFVTHLEYENRGTTWAYFEIDVMQTWQFDFVFQPSYVVREHQNLWESDGSPVVNTADEGLAYGEDYDTVNMQHVLPDGNIKWMVIVSTGLLHGDNAKDVEATYIGIPQPLSYYIIPFRGNDEAIKVLVEGEDFPISPPQKVLSNLYEKDSAVNNIVSIYMTESIGVDYEVNENGSSPTTIELSTLADVSGQVVGGSEYMLYVENVSGFTAKDKKVLNNKYDNFKDVKESKLLMYPYALTIVDDFKGNRMVVKNENIYDGSLTLLLKGSMGISNKTSWGVKHYNHDPHSTSYNDDIYSNEHAIINNNPTDVPIVNDMLSAFLQGNKNSMEQQKSNAITSAFLQSAGGIASAAAGGPMGMAFGALSVTGSIANTRDQLQGLQAKKKDIENMPPQIAKMGSNTSYDYGNGYEGVWVIQKQVKDEEIERLEDFFHMYGYISNRVKRPALKTRDHFNYVETRSCIIHGNMNNDDKTQIKTIFNNGITLWHTNDVGNYDLANGVRS